VELGDMGFEVFRSEANFVLFAGLKDSAEAFEQLLAKGILVRNVGIPHTLRVSAGTEAETTKFLEAAQDFAKL
jgi:histidinol-phosphate aminotransferase